MKQEFATALMMCFFPSAGIAAGQVTRECSVDVAFSSRTFLVHAPEKLPSRRAPLVIALHGGATNAKAMENYTGLSEAAERYGFIVTYPNGSGRLERMRTWNGGNCCAYAAERNVDDVAFIKKLIDHMVDRFNVDPSKVYATGISNGAIMAYRLAAEIPERLGAIAAIAGTLGINPEMVKPQCRFSIFTGQKTGTCLTKGDGAQGACWVSRSCQCTTRSECGCGLTRLLLPRGKRNSPSCIPTEPEW